MLNWFANRWNDFIDFLWRLVLSVYDMLKDFFIWVMEQLTNVGILVLNSIAGLLSGLDVVSYWSALPPETAYFLNMIGLSQALGMIITAIGIRLILQLIPFTRLGS